jgi:hypothetical protein
LQLCGRGWSESRAKTGEIELPLRVSKVSRGNSSAGKIAPAEVFEQGLEPASRIFQILTAQPFQLVEVSIQVSF